MKKLFAIPLVMVLFIIGTYHSPTPPHKNETGKIKMATGGSDFRGYLYNLAQGGDNLAARALQYTGNDGGVDPRVFKAYGNTDALDIVKYVNQAAQNYQTPPTGGGASGGQSSAGSTAYGGGSVASTPAADQASINAYNQAINNTQSAVDRLPAQLQSGYGSIDASYQDALNKLLLSKNQGQSAYNTNKQQTATDYVQAKNTIGANAGSTLQGLLRLLGSRGAGGSSAYNIAAPQAVARSATLQRQDVGNTFGANNQALDTNWNNYLTGYNNEVSSAGNQKDAQRQSLEQNINTNKASLLQSLAQLAAQKNIAQGGTGTASAQPYLDQANNILSGLSTYNTSPINYQTSAYTAPSLASYTASPTTPTYQGQSQSNDYYSPYLGALLGKKQQPLAA